MTPRIPENFSTWLVDGTLVAIMGDTPPPREARPLKVWAEQNAVSVLIIPTEPFFTRRTRGIFHREFYGTDVRIEIFTSERRTRGPLRSCS
jgi:hypothetical protein